MDKIPAEMVHRVDQAYAEARAGLADLLADVAAGVDERGYETTAALISVEFSEWPKENVWGTLGLALVELVRRERDDG